MKKFVVFLLTLLCALPCLFLAGCGESANLNSYSIVLTYDHEAHVAECSTVIEYVNNSNNSLKEVKFHLYPNAFSEEAEGSVCTPANEEKTYPNGKSWGGVAINNVFVNGGIVEPGYEGDADTILCVPLTEELFPDEKVKIEIGFTLTLPNALHRFGYGDNTVNFANFYPIACVYEEGDGFKSHPYVSNGDPFYSDVANYNVTVSYSKDMKIACGGDKITTHENGNYLTTTFTAANVRDVSFVLSDKFNQISAKAGDVTVEYYYYSDANPRDSLALAVKAVNFYAGKFGDYPYSNLAVVETGFVHGGMEYPRLVMISDDVRTEDYGYVIAHEIAHQWWYGVVGNDEFEDAWLDESLTEFSTALFFENHPEYGIDYSSIVDGAAETYKHFLSIYGKIIGQVDTTMDRPLTEFNTEPEYVNNIYTRGILLFDTLRQELGDKKLYSCLKGYYKEFAYKNVSKEDFIDYFSSKSGRNLEKFFESWLEGKVAIVGTTNSFNADSAEA